MKHADCTGCGLPVLELEGQFERMQPHEIENRELPAEQSGWWHTACLIASAAAPVWAAARQHTYRTVRGYELIAEVDGWIVLHHARRRSHRDRSRWRADRPRGPRLEEARAKGSRRTRVRARRRRLQPRRQRARRDPGDSRRVREGGLVSVALGLRVTRDPDRVQHPVALEQGSVAGVRAADSKHFITMRLEYGVFVPDALLPFVVPGP